MNYIFALDMSIIDTLAPSLWRNLYRQCRFTRRSNITGCLHSVRILIISETYCYPPPLPPPFPNGQCLLNNIFYPRDIQYISNIDISRCAVKYEYRCRIIGRNPDKSVKSFSPCYSQSPLQLCLEISISSNSHYLLRFLQFSYCTL
jgi:hypothetical protein